jgi:hypothetical protein
MKPEKVGEIDVRVIGRLNLLIEPNAPIYVSKTNLEHMKRKHPEDFEKYGNFLVDILKNADYVSKHPQKESIEYIKVFSNGMNQDYVLVAVRGSKQGKYYARTLFVMGQEKVWKYRKKGVLWKLE